ncbi:hypothetical protein Tco_0720711 [Tanacetum coccineum]
MRKSWPLFKSKKIAQVVRARIQSKNSLVKHFEDMRLCRPSKEYFAGKLVSMVNVEGKVMLVNALRRFRESLRRVTDGAKAFLILTLFILCLDKVSTDHAKSPKPIKNPSQCTLTRAISLTDILTLQALISLTDFPLLNNMLLLSPVLSTTMIRILWKRLNECLSFHEVIDFLRRSYIYHALTVSPVVSTTFVEQFWTSAKYNSSSKEIKLLKAKITKLKKQAKPVIKHHKAYLKSLSLQQRFPRKSFSKKHRVHKEYVSKQGRKKAKGESSVQRNPLFDVLPEDKIDPHGNKNCSKVKGGQDKGVSTDFEKVSTDRPKVSTDGSKVSTDEQVEGTEEQREATLLINMSQAKAASKEKEKGVELKDDQNSLRDLQEQEKEEQFTMRRKEQKEVKEEDKGEENTRKRKHGTRKKMKSRKRRFKQDTSQDDPSDIEKENDELRLCLTIATDEDKEVDYEILDKKYPIIDWKN